MLDFPLAPAKVGRSYRAAPGCTGGIPAYDWQIAEGQLPRGLVLDRFSGEISGRPRISGRFRFALRVRDSLANSPGVTRSVELSVRP